MDLNFFTFSISWSWSVCLDIPPPPQKQMLSSDIVLYDAIQNKVF